MNPHPPTHPPANMALDNQLPSLWIKRFTRCTICFLLKGCFLDIAGFNQDHRNVTVQRPPRKARLELHQDSLTNATRRYTSVLVHFRALTQ